MIDPVKVNVYARAAYDRSDKSIPLHVFEAHFREFAEKVRNDALNEAAAYHDTESEYYGTRHGDKDGVPFRIVSGWHELDAKRIRDLRNTDYLL